jgi:hypothetical protein
VAATDDDDVEMLLKFHGKRGDARGELASDILRERERRESRT